jgi:hypothetical protein
MAIAPASHSVPTLTWEQDKNMLIRLSRENWNSERITTPISVYSHPRAASALRCSSTPTFAPILKYIQKTDTFPIPSDAEWRRNIAAMHFGVPVDRALQVLVRQSLQIAIAECKQEDFDSLNEIAKRTLEHGNFDGRQTGTGCRPTESFRGGNSVGWSTRPRESRELGVGNAWRFLPTRNARRHSMWLKLNLLWRSGLRFERKHIANFALDSTKGIG